MRALIVGGGAIGASIAYRLALGGTQVTLIEQSAIACAASGKSGGFLARDWCDGTPLMQLARRSFDLHATLVSDLDGDWGYRRLTTYGGVVGRPGSRRSPRPGSPHPGPDWTSSEVRVTGQLGAADTTAQVHPAAFTAAMMRAAQDHGAALRLGRVTGLKRRGDAVVGVEIDKEVLEGDAIVIAMGPWSASASQWLSLPPVFGFKGHSLVFETGGMLPPEALFLEAEEADGSTLTPEVFPRADGTTYVCAISRHAPLPADPGTVAPDEGAIDRLTALCARISPVLARSRVLASGACFRPMTQDGLPLIGPIPKSPGAFVATGHSVWGILNAPATAEAMAEIILDGAAKRLDVSPFHPARLPALDPGRIKASGGEPRS